MAPGTVDCGQGDVWRRWVGIRGQVKKILKHLGLWDQKARPRPKRANVPPPKSYPDYSDSQVPFSDDYLYCDPDYPVEAYEQG